jgi:hypothetical protein
MFYSLVAYWDDRSSSLKLHFSFKKYIITFKEQNSLLVNETHKVLLNQLCY